MRKVLLGIGCFLCLIFAEGTMAFSVPSHEGFITDTANILTLQEKEGLESTLSAFRQETSNEIAVLIISSLDGESIADTAVTIGRAWGVGTKENDNGVLLLIAIEDRELFIATGYGLEGAVPDIIAKHIIDQEITPYFREGEYAAGIRNGIDALMASTRGEYTPELSTAEQSDGGSFAFVFAGLILLQWLVAILGRTKSWWFGGILGAIAGIIFTLIFAWWLLIPLLTILGALLDYVVSKNYRSTRRTSFWAGGNWGPGGGGGFSGFGGGSFGGGGAGGRW